MLDIGGDLRNSVIAQGNITKIHVGYHIGAPRDGEQIEIKSVTGGISEILVQGSVLFSNGMNSPGFEVSILAGSIGTIECGDFGGFISSASDPENGYVTLGTFKTNSARGTFAGSFFGYARVETFQTIDIEGYADEDGTNNPLMFVIRDFPTASVLRIGDFCAGRIIVGDRTGARFKGQVIIGARVPDQAWDDFFEVSTAGGVVTLTPRPYYTQVGSTYGDGAVGRVHYAIAAQDCLPVALTVVSRTPTVDEYSVTIDRSQFTDENPFTIEFFGPVRAENVGDPLRPPLHLYSVMATSEIAEATCMTTQEVRRVGGTDSPSRLVRVFYTGAGGIMCGNYTITNVTETPLMDDCVRETAGLYCDGLFAPPVGPSSPVPVRPFVIRLRVTGCGPCAAPCVADVDDGNGTGNPDGGVTIDDLLYYLGIFDAGAIQADIDDGSGTGTPDGGVTIDDLLYFLYRFDCGC